MVSHSIYSYIFCINSYVYVSLFFVLALLCFLDRQFHFFNNYSCDLFHWAEFIYTVQRERAAVHV